MAAETTDLPQLKSNLHNKLPIKNIYCAKPHCAKPSSASTTPPCNPHHPVNPSDTDSLLRPQHRPRRPRPRPPYQHRRRRRCRRKTPAPTEVPTERPTAAPRATPASSPTPAPTPTPDGRIAPLQMQDSGAFRSALSEAELACIGENPERQTRFFGCLEDETLARVFLAGFVPGPEPLSQETSDCVRDAF